MLRTLSLLLALAVPAAAQEAPPAPTGGLTDPLVIDRSATGGAQTLEDILARQEALRVDDGARRANTVGDGTGPAPTDELGARGAASDSHLWRALRYGTAEVGTVNGGPAAGTLIQDSGMAWLEFRNGPLRTWGAALLGGTLLLLASFYLIRGRIKLHGPRTGRTVTRFTAVERFAHWLLAGSFLALALTGVLVLFGRVAIVPYLGHEAWAPMAVVSKWVHNNVAWAFMLALVLVFVFWVVHNLPRWDDVKWLARGGGLFGGGHVPARKFNAGQKLIFWAVILGGASLSLSGLSLLFPFELPMFAKTFAWLNATGLPETVGYPLPEALAPQQEMQLAQAWHAIVAFGLTAIIFAHIYLGSVGMEGAYDAMGSGEVEETWAREHHSIWAEAAIAKRDAPPAAPGATPAE